MSDANPYPQPQEDADNRYYIRGWREGKLFIQQCRACGHRFHYPRPFCPDCFAAEVEWIAASGKGKIVSFSLVHRPNDLAFSEETPIILCEIELAEGPTMLARLLVTEATQAIPDAAVRLLKHDGACRYPLPIFEL